MDLLQRAAKMEREMRDQFCTPVADLIAEQSNEIMALRELIDRGVKAASYDRGGYMGRMAAIHDWIALANHRHSR